MIHVLALLATSGDAPFQPLHPLRYWGYEFWSGSGSDFGQLTLITGMIFGLWKGLRVYHKHVECHEEGCSRHGKYVVEGGVRFCEIHHPATGHKGEATKLHVAHLDHLKRHA